MQKKKIEINEFLKEILKDPRIPEEFGLNRCIQCGNCSASCPAARYTSYRPRRIIQEILLGTKNNLLEGEDIWLCYSCFSCNLRCPRNNNPGLIIHIIRNMAIDEGYGLENVKPFKSYLESLRDLGIGWSNQLPLREFFLADLGDNWAKIKNELPEILQELQMNPIPPREIPKDARDQIKKILELANINEDIKKIELDVKKNNNKLRENGDA
ncbi:MAG: 4Fe-4S dicluster domain-containing protein [Candidatus Helarchaeota archaeon]